MKVIYAIVSASLLIESVTGIIGGTIVKKGTKTYVTGLRTTIDPNSDNDFSFCGGALITRSHVLTTASCTTTAKANFVSVGAHYINGGGDGVEIKVTKVTNHPKYNATDFTNDFAVLTLAQATDHVQVNLPASDGSDIRSGSWPTVMGWGLTSVTGMASEELRQLGQQVITNDACRKQGSSVTLSQVCTAGTESKSPCGDSGGPLVLENLKKDNKDVLIGLVSATNCGAKNSPTLYARVSSAVSWINSVTKA